MSTEDVNFMLFFWSVNEDTLQSRVGMILIPLWGETLDIARYARIGESWLYWLANTSKLFLLLQSASSLLQYQNTQFFLAALKADTETSPLLPLATTVLEQLRRIVK